MKKNIAQLWRIVRISIIIDTAKREKPTATRPLSGLMRPHVRARCEPGRGTVGRVALPGWLWKSFLSSARLLVPLCLFFLFPAGIHPQADNLEASPLVLVLPVSLGEDQDPGFHGVLVSAMELQLEQAGLGTLRLPAGEEAALSARYGASGEIDLTAEGAELFTVSSRAGADFLLVGGYIVEKEGIMINFYLADVKARQLLASVAKQARIDFSLDRVMFQALEEMRPRVEQPIARAARRKAEAAARAAGEQESGAKMPEQVKSEAETMQPEIIPPAGPEAGADEPRFRPHEFSIGFAPFVPVGWSNETFNLSYSPFVYWNHRRLSGGKIVGLGAFAAVNLLEPQALGLASYLHTLISAGVDFRITGLEDHRLVPFGRLTGGAAFNVSDFSKLPDPDDLSRFMGFFAGGGGAMLAFSPSVGLAVDVTYAAFVYFWQEEKGGDIEPQWIMGFSPSIYIYTRL
jgi:hypothetical protein